MYYIPVFTLADLRLEEHWCRAVAPRGYVCRSFACVGHLSVGVVRVGCQCAPLFRRLSRRHRPLHPSARGRTRRGTVGPRRGRGRALAAGGPPASGCAARASPPEASRLLPCYSCATVRPKDGAITAAAVDLDGHVGDGAGGGGSGGARGECKAPRET